MQHCKQNAKLSWLRMLHKSFEFQLCCWFEFWFWFWFWLKSLPHSQSYKRRFPYSSQLLQSFVLCVFFYLYFLTIILVFFFFSLQFSVFCHSFSFILHLSSLLVFIWQRTNQLSNEIRCIIQEYPRVMLNVTGPEKGKFSFSSSGQGSNGWWSNVMDEVPGKV